MAFALTVAHGIAYQLIEKRPLSWVVVFAALIAGATILQFSGFVLTRRAARNSELGSLFIRRDD
jgi:hypothetical protein